MKMIDHGIVSKVFNLLLSIKEGEKNKTVYEEKAEEKFVKTKR